MTYYETLEEDLDRAKEILAKGRLTDEDVKGISPELAKRFVEMSGAIHGTDAYAAYKLLESFVAEIERMALEIRTLKSPVTFAGNDPHRAAQEHAKKLGEAFGKS